MTWTDSLGIAANIAQVVGTVPLLGIFAVLYRKHNCHAQGCWRIQWRMHEGNMLCRRHHPLDPPVC